MTPVASVTEIGGRVIFWHAHEPAVRADLSCCAVRTGEGLFFIDPIPLAASALDAVLAGGGAAGIILTNGNHQRASLEFRERLDCPIFAHAGARGEVAADQWLAGGARVADLAIIELPGSGPGEIALLATHGPGILVLGDAIINLAPEGLRPLPEKYCTDPAEARASLEKLRNRPFEMLCLAHGPPVTQDAMARLEAVLDRAGSRAQS